MHRSLLLICVVFMLLSVQAQEKAPGPTRLPDDPAAFVKWSSADIEKAADFLDLQKGRSLSFVPLGNYPGHSVYLVLRGVTGTAELHETEADLFVAKRGTATLVIGGELVDGKQLPRKQQRATSIKGGVRRELAPGDVVHIPMGIPHHLIVPPGERFMYVLTKFDEEPLQ